VPSTAEKPMMAFSGVRSSWLISAGNSLLAALALVSDCSARSSSCSRACSSRTLPVNSASPAPMPG